MPEHDERPVTPPFTCKIMQPNKFNDHRAHASVFEPRHGSLAFAGLFYQKEHVGCELIARSLHALAERTNPALSSALKFSAVSDCEWSAVLSAGIPHARKAEEWGLLQNAGFAPFNPTDREGKAATQCVIIIGAQYLLKEEQRKPFVDTLASVGDGYSQFLIIFGAALGEVPFHTEEGQFRGWIHDFAKLYPKVVALHLVSTEFDDGKPLSEKEMAEGVAVALLRDLNVTGRGSVRILSDIDESAFVALHVFGAKAVMYDPESAVKSLNGSVVAELVQQTCLVRSTKDNDELKSLLSAREIFARLNLQQEGVAVHLLQSAGLHGPVLSGRNYAVGFDFEGASADLIVKRNPPADWCDSFRNQHEFLFHATVPAASSRISEALAEFRCSQLQDLINQVSSLVTHGGLLQAQQLCTDYCDRIAELYWTADSPEIPVAANIETRLLDLDSAVGKIPSASQLILKGIARVAPFGLLAAAVWLLSLPFQLFWFCLSGFAVGACAAHLVWCRWCAVQTARNAARLVAKQIHRELRTSVIGLTREALAREERVAREEAEALKTRISNLIEALVPLQFERDRKCSLYETGTIKRVPWNQHQLKFLDELLHERDSFARIHSEGTRIVSDALPGILEGTEAAEVIAAKLRSLSNDYCRQRFSRLSLAELLQNGVVENDEEESRLNSRPDVFLQNCVVNDCRSQSHRVRRAILVPGRMEGITRNEPTTTPQLGENILASVVRVELARISDTSYMRDSSVEGKFKLGLPAIDPFEERLHSQGPIGLTSAPSGE